LPISVTTGQSGISCPG